MTKILVIDDEAMLREEIEIWLAREGYEVAGAEDGLAGVEVALRNPPDLIICDVTMPRLDGYGVLLEVHAHPATAHIPFIFVTARAAHEDIRKGMAMGADDYITKPFTRQELLQTVQARLEKTATQEQKYQQELEQLQSALDQEREQRMLKAKMVAMFSHDFRNPLSTIRITNELLRQYGDRIDEQRRLTHMARIDEACRQLVQMLDDMLVVAQMEVGKLDLTPELLSAEQFLQHIVEEFQAMHGATHQLVFESHLTGPMWADPRLLRQIAVNLISNAIKYSPQGGEVRITLDRDAEQQSILTVQDQGIGIPETDQGRLFAAFQRGSNVRTVPGTGLGLAIVKQAVELHGGSLQLESHSGVGTTVSVAIPSESTPD